MMAHVMIKMNGRMQELMSEVSTKAGFFSEYYIFRQRIKVVNDKSSPKSSIWQCTPVFNIFFELFKRTFKDTSYWEKEEQAGSLTVNTRGFLLDISCLV